MFAEAGVAASIARETFLCDFESVEHAVRHYADNFGPFVMTRGVLEPQGRWMEFLDAFGGLVRRFSGTSDIATQIQYEYFLITADR
jgi:hypothetical protein